MGAKQDKDQIEEIKEDYKESIKSNDVEYYIMKNPYIIIMGITDYDKPYTRLRAVPQDIKNMKHLWLNKFKYDENYVTIITEEIGSKYVTLKQLNKELSKIQGRLNLEQYKKCDGLIIIYSGHGSSNGLDNYILCSDKQKLSFLTLQNKFASQQCAFLENMPKVLYIDCCRGNQGMQQGNIQYHQAKGNKGITDRYINRLSDFYLHFATCQDFESWGKSEEEGSHFIYALYKCYMNNYDMHKMNGISLHESSIKINELVNKSHSGQQTSEIMDRLTYNVFIQPQTDELLSDNVLSRRALIMKYNDFYDQAMQKKEEYERKIQELSGKNEQNKKQYIENLKIDCKMNVVLIGDMNSGKTCLMRRFMQGVTATICVDSMSNIVTLSDKVNIELTVWDTTGAERCQSLTTNYYRRAECIIVCYDISIEDPFRNISRWMEQIMDYGRDDVLIMLVGCKEDLVIKNMKRYQKNTLLTQHIITQKQWKVFTAKHCTCSSKDGDNVDNVFVTAAQLCWTARYIIENW